MKRRTKSEKTIEKEEFIPDEDKHHTLMFYSMEQVCIFVVLCYHYFILLIVIDQKIL